MKSQTTIDEEAAQKAKQEATRDKLISEIAELNAKIDRLDAEMKAETARWTADLAKRNAVIEDLNKAVFGLDGAIKAMGSGDNAALLSVSAVVRKNLLLADALGMASGKNVDSFLQTEDPYNKGDFESKAGGIVDTLNDLKEDFGGRLETEMEEKAKAKSSHGTLMSAKSDEKNSATDSKDTKETQRDEAISAIGVATENLISESATLTETQKYLKTLTSQCEVKAREHDQRSGMQAGELAALTKALDILEGKVKDKEGKRTFLNQSQSVLKRAPQMYSYEEDSMSFVQVKSSRARVASLVRSTSNSKRNTMIAQLQASAKKMGSEALFHFGNRLKAGPFDKVKGLIQTLIERLLAESAAEATHKGWCDSSLATARKNREYAHEKSEKLNGELESNEATRDAAQEKIDELTDELKSLNDELKDATDIRTDEKKANLAAIKDAKEGLAATEEALAILKNFYKGEHGAGGADTASYSFVQQPERPTDDNEDLATQGAYQGNQAAAGGILGLLNVIVTDFKRTIEKTSTAEKEAAADFVLFSRESNVSIMAAETEKKNNENVHTEMVNAIKTGMNDLKDQVTLMDTAVKEVEELKPACIDTGMSYEERVAKREEEIAALKKAVCQLDPEGKEAECA
jgi:hypothetical protein